MTDAPPNGQESRDRLPPAPAEDEQRLSVTDYVVVVALFLVFLLICYVAMFSLFHDTGGLTVFFVLLGVGFVIVAVYDFLFDRLCRRSQDDSESE